MAFDSVFNGNPNSQGVSASGKASFGVDISSNTLYVKDDGVAGWQAVSSSGGSGNLLTAVVTLTPAQIKAMHATPVTLIPAPGVGKTIWIVSAALVYNFATIAYSSGSNNLVIASAGQVAADDSWFVFPANTIIDNTYSTAAWGAAVANQGGFTGPLPLSEIQNSALTIRNDSTPEFTLGDGTITVTIVYYVQ
jgi:hypothetical protein